MPKPKPDQEVFQCPQDVKVDIFYAPSPEMPGNYQRYFQNISPTLRVSKKKAPQATNIGNYSPYLRKV